MYWSVVILDANMYPKIRILKEFQFQVLCSWKGAWSNRCHWESKLESKLDLHSLCIAVSRISDDMLSQHQKSHRSQTWSQAHHWPTVHLWVSSLPCAIEPPLRSVSIFQYHSISIYASIYLSIYPSIYLSIYLSIFLIHILYTYTHIYIYMVSYMWFKQHKATINGTIACTWKAWGLKWRDHIRGDGGWRSGDRTHIYYIHTMYINVHICMYIYIYTDTNSNDNNSNRNNSNCNNNMYIYKNMFV